MRILVTGGDGQLGRAVQRRAVGHEVVAIARGELDVTESDAADRIRSLAPNAVINAAAMTDVDGCERDRDAAFRVNALGAHPYYRALAGLTASFLASDARHVAAERAAA